MNKFDKLYKVVLENIDNDLHGADPRDKYAVLFMRLAFAGHTEFEDELADILSRSTADESYGLFSYLPNGIPNIYDNADENTFDELLNELDSYDWKISFKDFPTLTEMKHIFKYKHAFSLNANYAQYRDLYEKLAKAGYFSKKHLNTDEKIANLSSSNFKYLNDYIQNGMSDEYYCLIIDFLEELDANPDGRIDFNDLCSHVVCLMEQAHVSRKVMLRMLHSTSAFVRERLAKMQTLTRKFIECLAADSDVDVRTSLACSRSTKIPEDIMLKLADDEDQRVVVGLSKRFSGGLPENVAMAIAERATKASMNVSSILDSDEFGHEPSQNVMRKLADALSWNVRYALLKQRNVPLDVVKKLMTDSNSRVRELAKSKYELLSQQNAKTNAANESIDVYSIYTRILSESNEPR